MKISHHDFFEKLNQKEREARLSVLKKSPPFPMAPAGGFGILYPDPPWKYSDKGNAGNRGAEHKYPTLSLLELKMLRPEVDACAAGNCAMAMWATGPMMSEARELLAAWGFKFSTILFTWIKTYSVEERIRKAAKKFEVDPDAVKYILDAAGVIPVSPRKGMGNWTRGNAEYCLLGVRGKVERLNKGVGSVIISETREHSRKPDEARTKLVELFGRVPRLEMFAREAEDGWNTWGLEPEKFDA